MPREITDVVEVDIVLTTCAMNELDVGWVEMQLEELPEGILQRLIGKRDEWCRLQTDPTHTERGNFVRGEC